MAPKDLALVLTPYGKVGNGYPPAAIDYTYKGATTFYGSIAANEVRFDKPGVYDPRLDPQFHRQSEAGYYYDTPLGAAGKPGLFQRIKARWQRRRALSDIPTDFEVATRYGYLPVMSGWVRTKQGYATGPWLPPHGDPAWAGYPTPIAPLERQLTGLGADPAVTPQPAATVEDVMLAITAHNDRLFALTLVSTTAVAVSALLGVFRTLKLIREDK